MAKSNLVLRRGEDPKRVSAECVNKGYLVFTLPLGISDKTSFFEAVKTEIPLDPPVVGREKWEALSDSMWSGLDQLAAKKIAIIWPKAAFDIEPELEIAREILEEVSSSLCDSKMTDGNPKEVLVFIT